MGDMGGKTESSDKCVLDTIRREVGEETNYALFGLDKKRNFDNYFDILLENSKCEPFYFRGGKYLVLKVTFGYKDLPMCIKNLMNLSNDRFGKVEETDGIEHYFKWMKSVDKNNKLHIRLHSNYYELFC